MPLCLVKFAVGLAILAGVLNCRFSASKLVKNDSKNSEIIASDSKRTLLVLEDKTANSTSLVLLNKFVFITLLKYWWLKYACGWYYVKYLLGNFCDGFIEPAAPDPIIIPQPIPAPAILPKISYAVVAQMLPWMEAHLYCKSNGYELTTVETQQELDLIESLITPIGFTIAELSFWTAGNDIYREGNFTWVSTGYPISTFWPVGNTQPNNAGGNENCVNIIYISGSMEYIMNDFDCLQSLYFICKQNVV